MKLGLLLSLISLLLAADVEDSSVKETNKTLELNSVIEEHLDLNNRILYELTLPAEISDSKQLYIVADGVTPDPADTPSIIVLTDNQTIQCFQTYQSDICSIEAKTLKPSSKLTVVAECLLECNFTIQAYLSQSYKLGMDEQIQINTGIQEGFNFIVEVPKDLNFSSVGILVELRDSRLATEKLQIGANVGKQPKMSDFKFKGQEIWNAGVGVFLNSSDVNAGDIISVMVKATKNIVLVLSSYHKNGEIREVQLNSIVSDVCKRNSSNVYNISLPDLSDRALSIRMVRYSGHPVMRVSGSSDKNISMLQADTFESINALVLSSKIRKQYNITNNLYIHITALIDATYLFVAEVDGRGFMELTEMTPEISILEAGDIDNYLFSYLTHVNKADNNFVLKVSQLEGKVEFAVRSCVLSKEEKNYTKCVLKDKSEFKREEFNTVGFSKTILKTDYFTFRQQSKDCVEVMEQTKYCLLHIVVMTSVQSKYLVEINTVGVQNALSQSAPNTFAQFQGPEQFYSFTMDSIENVDEVRFVLSEITGDCIMVGSQTKRYPVLSDEVPNDIAKDNTLAYTSISSKYYLSVKCFSVSYYIINVYVKRVNTSGDAVRPYIMLWDSTWTKYSMTSKQKQAKFLLQLPDDQPFMVEVLPFKGHIWFQVYAYNDGIKGEPWISNGNVLKITNDGRYESENVFLVIVHSETEATFGIQFRTEDDCLYYYIGRPLPLSMAQNTSKCIVYYMHKAEELDIVLSSASYQLMLNNIRLNVTLNNETKQISNRETSMSQEDIVRLCPSLRSQNYSMCLIRIDIQANKNVSFTLVLEYSTEPTALFDGIIQKSTNNRFYYELTSQNGVIVMMHGQNKMIGRLVTQNTFFSKEDSQLYPLTSQDQKYIQSTRLIGGNEAIYLTEELLANCTNCVLLISLVDTNKTVEIEVSQTLTPLTIGANFMGYTDKGFRNRYILASNKEKSIMVNLHTFVEECAIVNQFTMEVVNETRKKVATADSVLILPKQNPQFYILEVQGRQSCLYHISAMESANRIYNLKEGIFYDLDLSSFEKTHLLYYNTDPTSFSIVPQFDYGDLSFKAMRINNIDNLEEQIKKLDKQFTFSSQNYEGALRVSNTSSSYCTECYYIISAQSIAKTSVTLLVHSLNQPIPVRADKLIYNVLKADQQSNYILYTNKSFNISLDVIIGKVELLVQAEGRIILKQTVENTIKSSINYDLKELTYTLYNGMAPYNISLKASTYSSYTMQIVQEEQTTKIKFGVPTHLNLPSNHQECLEFSLEKSHKNAALIFSMDDTTTFNYEVTCQYDNPQVLCKDTESIVSIEVTDQNVHLQLVALSMTYTVCVKSVQAMNVSALLSFNELKVLEENTALALKTDSKSYLSVYHPFNKSAILVEVYECRGQGFLTVSDSYMGLIRGEKSNISLLTNRETGHLIGTFDTPKEGLYFLSLTPMTENNSLLKVKYSWYDDHNPYFHLDLLKKDITYSIVKDNYLFNVSAAQMEKEKYSSEYILYISNDTNVLQASSQCGIKGSYNQTIAYSDRISQPDTITFSVSKKVIDSIAKNSDDSKYLYATVVLIVTVKPTITKNNDEYRILFNRVEVANMVPVVQEATKPIIWKVSTIFIVVIAALSCGFCMWHKKVVRRIRNFISGDNELFQDTLPDSSQNEGIEMAQKKTEEKREAVVTNTHDIQ